MKRSLSALALMAMSLATHAVAAEPPAPAVAPSATGAPIDEGFDEKVAAIRRTAEQQDEARRRAAAAAATPLTPGAVPAPSSSSVTIFDRNGMPRVMLGSPPVGAGAPATSYRSRGLQTLPSYGYEPKAESKAGARARLPWEPTPTPVSTAQ